MSNSSDTGDASGVAVIDRAFSILQAFRASDTTGLSLAELAARTGLYKSTLLRLADALIHHRMLVRLDDGRYRIGPACFALGAMYQQGLNLSDVVPPLMRELSGSCGEGVSFYIRDRDLRVCVHRVDSQHAVRYHVREGDTLPLDSGSGGLTLLAFGGERGDRFEQIRRDGYCSSIGERHRDTAGISAPVFGLHDSLRGVITLAGPTSRIDQPFLDRMLPDLLSTAARATEALGGNSMALRQAADRALKSLERAG